MEIPEAEARRIIEREECNAYIARRCKEKADAVNPLGSCEQSVKSKYDYRAMAAQAKRTKQPPQTVQLPLWPESKWAIPNAICRSALFAPIKRGKRPLLDDVLIASRMDVQIRYNGLRLDMADSDVFLALLHIAKGMEIRDSERIYFRRGTLLRHLGRAQGRAQYDWLHKAIKRLTAAMLEVEWKSINGLQKIAGLHLIEDYDYDPNEGDWYVRLSSKIVYLFEERAYSLICWNQRLTLQAPLSKWLQTYVASHRKGQEHRISLTKLQAWSGSEGRSRRFCLTLAKALDELKAQGAIDSWEFARGSKGEAQVRWVRSAYRDPES